MNNLIQIVVQETATDQKRSLAQYGEGITPEVQKEIIYSELTTEEKSIYDAFINMIKSK
jgi:hypothetical protein